MRDLNSKILTSFTYEELYILKQCLKEVPGLNDKEKELLNKLDMLTSEGEKWF